VITVKRFALRAAKELGRNGVADAVGRANEVIE
jgi:hypothetical protein